MTIITIKLTELRRISLEIPHPVGKSTHIDTYIALKKIYDHLVVFQMELVDPTW